MVIVETFMIQSQVQMEKIGRNASFDDIPVDNKNKEVCVKRIITLCVAASEEEEQENDHEAEEYDKIEDKE